MTDQELDTLMRRVLLDSLKLDAESTASGMESLSAQEKSTISTASIFVTLRVMR